MNPIAWLLANGKVSPAFGRFLEIGFYTALAAVLGYCADVLTAGKVPELRVAGVTVLTALMAYAGKAARDEKAAIDNLTK